MQTDTTQIPYHFQHLFSITLSFWSLILQLGEDEGDLQIIGRIASLYKMPRQIKHSSNFMADIILNGNEHQFKAWFRLEKRTFLHLHDWIFPDNAAKSTGRPRCDSAIRLCIFLSKVAHNLSFNCLSDISGASVGSAHAAFVEVCDLVASLSSRVILWPTQTRQIICASFQEKCLFPNVIGAIDGTHVRIKRPHDFPDNYVNRKSVHSLNVLAVCDSDAIFTYVRHTPVHNK
jgi:hypothetical protein